MKKKLRRQGERLSEFLTGGVVVLNEVALYIGTFVLLPVFKS